MNLLDLAVKITCDDQASDEVDKIGDGIKNTLGAAAKVGVAAVAALGTATVAIGKTALDAYSNYEQLVGGIDTLFKASSGKMQRYAANAYQTAGVSANRYMEISTSFAAALISSLGGNTEAAADMANTAITDMSDNANKMGTSLETVQEAYQSLARGNYEMLDSLKLGYGGTKSELQRLLDDAEKYAAAQGEVRDFSIDSYSDIVEAIHIVQDEMGITGTTAEEAATTIEGSVNTMKAAWQNWLTGLGDDDADMSALTDNLVQSVITAGQNVIPRVGEIMASLGSTFASYAPQVAQQLYDGLMASLPESVRGPLQQAVDGAGEVLGYLQETLGPGIQQAMELVGPIVEQVSEFFSHMGKQIQDVLGPAMDFLGQAFTDAMAAIEPWIEPLGNVAQLFGNILVAAIAAFAYAIGGIMEIFSGVTGAITDLDAFLNGQPSVIGTVIQGIITWFQQLPGNIASFLGSVISSVASWVGQMASNAVSAGSQFISGLAGFLSALPGNVASWLSGAISTVVGWVSQFASNAVSAASQFGSKLRDGLAAIPGTLGNIGSNIIQGLIDGVTGAAGRLIDSVKGAVGDAIQGAKNLLGIHSPSRVFRKIGQYTMQGAALGVDDDADLLSKSTDNAMRDMISTAQDIKYAPDARSAAATSSVIEWLDRNLGDVIASRTPYIGMRGFDRLAREAVARA